MRWRAAVPGRARRSGIAPMAAPPAAAQDRAARVQFSDVFRTADAKLGKAPPAAVLHATGAPPGDACATGSPVRPTFYQTGGNGRGGQAGNDYCRGPLAQHAPLRQTRRIETPGPLGSGFHVRW